MDEMRREGVKRASVEIKLTWFFGPRFLRVVRVKYFSGYDSPDSQVTDPRRLNQFRACGLEERLKQIALQRGLRGRWFESPPHQHPSRWWPVPAGVVAELLDDEWLPIFPSFYWNLDTSWTPLVHAVAADDRVDIERLLAQGDLEASDLDMALSWAAAGDDPAILRELLKAGARVNSPDKKGYTALMGAINNRKIANVKVLLDAGGDVNAKVPETGDTPLTLPLYYAYDSTQIIRCLLDKGADPNAANKYGRSALMLATFRKPRSVIEALLRAGADVNARDLKGNTALMEAADNNNLEAVEVLLAAHADASIKNSKGDTALSIASREGHTEIVKLLSK
jgi:ankyrin repeat protein